MKAKGKPGAPAGKQKRPAHAEKKPKPAAKPKNSNPLGEAAVHPSLPAGRDGNGLRDEDWKFHHALVNANRATLVAACWFEYARESQHVRDTMRRWLELQEIRDQLRPFVQRVFKMRLERGDTLPARPQRIPIDEANWAALAEMDFGITSWELFADFFEPAELTRSRELSGAFNEARDAEHEVQIIEARGGEDAPRLRTLAKHLVADCPWPRVPAEDRQRAIESRFRNRYDVPRSAQGSTHFRAIPAFEEVNWGDFVPPQFTDEEVRHSKDLYHREITHGDSLAPWRRAGDEVLPVLVRWGQFSDAEIIEDFTSFVRTRPNKWKHLAKRSGRGRADWWLSALKALSAMRLSHIYSPAVAREHFQQSFAAGASFDEAALARLRRNAVKVFGHFFPFGESPRHSATLTARNDR